MNSTLEAMCGLDFLFATIPITFFPDGLLPFTKCITFEEPETLNLDDYIKQNVLTEADINEMELSYSNRLIPSVPSLSINDKEYEPVRKEWSQHAN